MVAQDFSEPSVQRLSLHYYVSEYSELYDSNLFNQVVYEFKISERETSISILVLMF